MKTNEMMAKDVIEKSKKIINKRKIRNRTITLLIVMMFIFVTVVAMVITAGASIAKNPLPLPSETTYEIITKDISEKTVITYEAEKDGQTELTNSIAETFGSDEQTPTEQIETSIDTTAAIVTDIPSTESNEQTETERETFTDDETTIDPSKKDIDRNNVIWASESLEEDEGYGEFYGKNITCSLYEALKNPDAVIAVRICLPVEKTFVYNDKEYSKYYDEAVKEIEEEILAKRRYDAFMQCADQYISMRSEKPENYGGPLDWQKPWYDGMTEFFGQEFLSKYIDNNKPLYEKLEEDMNHISTTARGELKKVREAYFKIALKEAEEIIKAQNVEYSLNTDSIIVFVTTEDFKSLSLDKFSESMCIWASKFGQKDDMDF